MGSTWNDSRAMTFLLRYRQVGTGSPSDPASRGGLSPHCGHVTAKEGGGALVEPLGERRSAGTETAEPVTNCLNSRTRSAGLDTGHVVQRAVPVSSRLMELAPGTLDLCEVGERQRVGAALGLLVAGCDRSLELPFGLGEVAEVAQG